MEMKLGIKHQMIAVCVLLTSISLLECKKEITEPEPEPEDTIKAVVVEKANYYVAPDGNDANPGTIDKPFKNWDKIIKIIKPGDLVYLRGGTYYKSGLSGSNACYFVGKSGTPGNYIRIWAYPGEKPVLDCSTMNKVSGYGVLISGDYWHIKGIEIKNFPQGYDAAKNVATVARGIGLVNANNNIIENVTSHDNQGMGMGMGQASTNNLIKNCDFYNNYDPYTVSGEGKEYHGGNADGAQLRAYKGSVNTLKGCRFYHNSDDGLDLWENEGTMIIDSCWAFNNGYDMGDGNGFKYGRTLEPYEDITKRVTTHCLSYNNKSGGFDQNNANVKMAFYNNFAYKNGGKAYYMSKFNLKNTFQNNISYMNGDPYPALITAESINTNNSWNGITISDADFTSINMTGIDGPRKANGNLPDVSFLKPTASSNVVDKGIDVGFPYYGKAPDVGLFEYKK